MSTQKKKTKIDLFLELAKPDDSGCSRWVKTTEFKDNYADLKFGNGASWARKESTLSKKYVVEFKKAGHSIIEIRLNGVNNDTSSQTINAAIKREIKQKRCLVLGTSNPEVDHKNGRKDDERVHNTSSQVVEDFQPLSKAANDAKRQFCKDCKRTNKRYDAKLIGYPMSFTAGDINYNEELGCTGCYWYDVADFKNKLKKKDD